MNGMGMPHRVGMPRASAPEINLQGLQNALKEKADNNPNQNKPKNKLSSEQMELKKEKTKKALQKLHSKNYENKQPVAGKRISQPNILNNPKFAMLAKMMGGRVPGAPQPKKENKNEEIKIEVEKENQDDIIMSKPTVNKNAAKKKPKKINFIDDIVEEVSDEEVNEENESKSNENENNE